MVSNRAGVASSNSTRPNRPNRPNRPTRSTHEHDDDIAVFLIGFRINRLWALNAWLPVFLAMPKMLKELSLDSESGLLGFRLLFGWREATVVQYWRSVDDIYSYASDQDKLHRPAWTAFFARAAKHPGRVGIWHETYNVPVGNAESMYVDVPPMGLAGATREVPVSAATHTARQRMARRAA